MCDQFLMHLFLCSQLGAAYVSATTGAVVTALGLKSLASVMLSVHVHNEMNSIKMTVVFSLCPAELVSLTVSDFARSLQRLPPIVSRFVPFAAVAAANCINIPFMRQR